jgi:hypothetical protein
MHLGHWAQGVIDPYNHRAPSAKCYFQGFHVWEGAESAYSEAKQSLIPIPRLFHKIGPLHDLSNNPAHELERGAPDQWL